MGDETTEDLRFLLQSQEVSDVLAGLASFRKLAGEDQSAYLVGSGLRSGMYNPEVEIEFYSFAFGGFLAEIDARYRNTVAMGFLASAVASGLDQDGWTRLGGQTLQERHGPGASCGMGLCFEELPLAALPEVAELAAYVVGMVVRYQPMARVPDALYALQGLRYLEISNCELGECPQLGLWPKLRHLSLASNELGTLSPSIGQLTALQLLDVGMNWLRELPAELMTLTSIQTLTIGPLHELDAKTREQFDGWVSSDVGYAFVHEA